jgi:RimJ/RimL family protein N-acetyltransferase
LIPHVIAGSKRAFVRIRTRGPKEVFSLALQRAREEIHSGDTLLFLVRPATHETREGPGLHFKQATPEDADRYARDIGTDSATTFRSRLTPGTRCCLVEDGDKILHASWVTSEASWAREIRGWLVPPPGGAYVYESFTRSDARGRGIYPFALANIVSILADEGSSEVWIAVEADNAPSRRAIDKAGFTFAFELEYRRRWGRLTIDPPRGPRAKDGATFVRRGRGREK